MTSIKPTGKKLRNHCSQLIVGKFAFSKILMASKLGASAVRNSELLIQLPAKATHEIYAPIFRGSFLGDEPYNSGIFFTIGNIVPPLLAVFDGINGAKIKSASTIAYPKPNVLLPI